MLAEASDLRRFVDIDGCKIHYLEAGADKNTTLIIVHGLGGAAMLYQHTTKSIGRHYRTIALDLPGYGESAFCPPPLGIEGFADLVAQFIVSSCIKKPILLGHSMGAAVAIALAARHPQLVHGLILVDAAGIKPPAYAKGVDKSSRILGGLVDVVISLLPKSISRVDRQDVRRLLSYSFYDTGKLSDEAVEIKYRSYNSPYGREVIDAAAASLAKFDAADVITNSPITSIPTLILWGAADSLPVEHAYYLNSLIPNSRVEIIPECGHDPPLEAASIFEELVMQFIHEQCESSLELSASPDK